MTGHLYPASGSRREADAKLNTYRLLFVLAAALIPAFGFLYRYTDPTASDPLWLRLLLAALVLGAVGLSYVSPRVRRGFDLVYQAIIYVLTVAFVGLIAYNHFVPNYAVGLLFVLCVLGLSYGLGLRRLRPLFYYLTFATLLTTAILFATPEVAISRLLFTGVVVSMNLVIFINTRARIQIQQALRMSEAHLSEAQRIAHLGNYEWHPRTNQTYWSDEMYHLLDYAPGAVEPGLDAFVARIHPDDRAPMTEALQRVLESGAPGRLDLRILRQDGTERILRCRAEAVLDAGEPVRLFGTCLDVTEQHRHEAALVAAKEQAEEMSRLKSAFLANMSHEIRTPLTAILGFSDLLDEEVAHPHREFVRMIRGSGQRLMETLSAVLDLAHLESGRIEVRPACFDLAAQIRETIRHFEPQAARQEILLHARLPDRPVLIVNDRDLIERVLFNLIGNAVKFTHAGSVTVTVEIEAGRVRLRVADTGIGIAEDFLPHLFDAFRQESTGLARSHEGSGLGLAVTARFVHLMGGTIDVASRKDQGSTFTVVLPRTPADHPVRTLAATHAAPVSN